MSWYIVKCNYEGAGSGENIKILVESTDTDEIRRMVRSNKDKIDEFTEHSVPEDSMWSVEHESFDYTINSEEDVREILTGLFDPNYAIFKDGSILWRKYYNEIVTL